MDFLNEAIRQTKDALGSMTIGARIASGLLLIAIVVSLAYLFVFRTQSGTEYLYSGEILSQEDQAQIYGYFSEAGLKNWQSEGGRIRVPKGQLHKYYAALSAKGFFPKSPENLVSNALMDKTLFGTSREVRLERTRVAKEKEMSAILSTMNGIQKAWVRIDQQRKRGLHGALEATALASVRAEGGRQLEEDQIRAMRDALAYRYAPLRRQDVAILDLNANITYRGEHGAGGMIDDKYAETKRMYERMYRSTIKRLLGAFPGAMVEVSVDLDPKESTVTRKLELNPKTVPIETTETTSESKSSSGRRGRPGAAPNGVGNQGAQVARASTTPQNTKTESVNRTKARAGGTHTETKELGLTPKTVRAAIFIPESYYNKVWKEQQAALAASGKKQANAQPQTGDIAKIKNDTKTNIEEIVTKMLPALPSGVNPFPRVVVKSYQDLPAVAPTAPSVMSGVFTWLADNWSTLGMLGLGMFCLIMLRGVVSAAKPTPEDQAAMVAAVEEAGEITEEELIEEENGLLRRFSSTGRGLREELSELVREDPDAAASVLKNWVSEAA